MYCDLEDNAEHTLLHCIKREDQHMQGGITGVRPEGVFEYMLASIDSWRLIDECGVCPAQQRRRMETKEILG